MAGYARMQITGLALKVCGMEEVTGDGLITGMGDINEKSRLPNLKLR